MLKTISAKDTEPVHVVATKLIWCNRLYLAMRPSNNTLTQVTWRIVSNFLATFSTWASRSKWDTVVGDLTLITPVHTMTVPELKCVASAQTALPLTALSRLHVWRRCTPLPARCWCRLQRSGHVPQRNCGGKCELFSLLFNSCRPPRHSPPMNPVVVLTHPMGAYHVRVESVCTPCCKVQSYETMLSLPDCGFLKKEKLTSTRATLC